MVEDMLLIMKNRVLCPLHPILDVKRMDGDEGVIM